MRRVYYQRRDDGLGTNRVDAAMLGAPPPERGGGKVGGDIEGAGVGGGAKESRESAAPWELWVELYNEEYHASPVRWGCTS